MMDLTTMAIPPVREIQMNQEDQMTGRRVGIRINMLCVLKGGTVTGAEDGLRLGTRMIPT